MKYQESFLNYLYSAKGYSQNTISSYQSDLNKLQVFLSSIKKPFTQVKVEDLEHYLVWLRGLVSNRSIARNISSIKHFYDFLLTKNLITDNPASLIEHSKTVNKLPNFLSESEIASLLHVAGQDNSNFGIFINCMINILYATGLRVSELVTLKIGAIEKEFLSDGTNYTLREYIKIKGKGSKERLVPLNQSSLKSLYIYLSLRDKLLQNDFSEYLFTTKISFAKQGKSQKIAINANKKDNHISRQVFAKMLKSLALKAGIDPAKISPHTIRHSIATHLLKNGADLKVIQEILGHSDISTTQIYTHIINDKLIDTVKKHHPLSRIKNRF